MHIPARRLIKPTTPRTVHVLNLRGVLLAPTQSEATTERAFVLMAALCPVVRSITSQPQTIRLDAGHYTPDYCVETFDGRTSYWEVKLRRRVPAYRILFDQVAAHYAGQGTQFLLVSELELQAGHRYRAARQVMRYAKASFPDTELSRLTECLRCHPGGITTGELVETLGISRELVFHALARRLCAFKYDVSVEMGALIISSNTREANDVLCLANWFGVAAWRPND